MIDEFQEFLDSDDKDKLIQFVNDYNDWIKAQLRVGALIFPPDDYYFIWKGV